MNGWQKKTIGDLFHVQLGKMLSEKARSGNLYPYLANFNVRWGAFDFSKLNEMSFSDHEKDKYRLRKGDLLICEGGEIGRCAIWQRTDIEIYYQKALHRLRPRFADLSTGYLYFYMEFIATQGKLTRLVGETSIAHLTREKLLDLPITFPPLPEQKAIAELLFTWDEAIKKTERLIQAKEAKLKGQVQKLISQRCDSWPHIKPKKMFDTKIEKNFPDEELLSVTQDRGVIPRRMLEGRVMSPDGTKESYKLIKRGDYAISLRSFQGGIEYSNYQGIISPAYTVLRPIIELNLDFYRLFFKSYIFIEKYLNLAVIGIRDGKQISIPDFLSIKIPVPPLKVQVKIAEALKISHQEIELLKQLAEKYKNQKSGLMQKMLTGEWRVKQEVVKRYA